MPLDYKDVLGADPEYKNAIGKLQPSKVESAVTDHGRQIEHRQWLSLPATIEELRKLENRKQELLAMAKKNAIAGDEKQCLVFVVQVAMIDEVINSIKQ